MRILLAIDESPCSETAVAEVCDRPWPSGSEVRVVTAVQFPFLFASDTMTVPDNFSRQMETEARQRADARVARAVARLEARPGERLPVSTSIRQGDPRNIILQESDEWGADLIIVGSHGYHGLTRLMLGSVSAHVLSHAKCSVEIVRHRETTQEQAA